MKTNRRTLLAFAVLVLALLPYAIGATAGNGTSVTTASLVLFDATAGGPDAAAGGCTTFSVKNRSSSTGNVLVHVDGLHATGDFIGISPGDPPAYFRFGATNGITKVTVKTDISTATIDWGKVAAN